MSSAMGSGNLAAPAGRYSESGTRRQDDSYAPPGRNADALPLGRLPSPVTVRPPSGRSVYRTLSCLCASSVVTGRHPRRWS
jgi:hypothetical protein